LWLFPLLCRHFLVSSYLSIFSLNFWAIGFPI
jgi:hypothetical protein